MITRRGLIKGGLVGVGMVSHGVAIANQPEASGVLARVGAQTFAGVEVLRLEDNTQNALTGVSVTGGTATVAAYDLSATGVLSVASDAAMVGEDGNTITYTSDQGTGTITLSVDDSQVYNYSVASQADLSAALVWSFGDYLSSGACQIIMKDGNYTFSKRALKNRPYTNTMTLKSENHLGAHVTTQMDIYNADNITIDGLFLEQVILLQFGSDTITIRNCELFHKEVLTLTDAYAQAPGGPGSPAIWGLGKCSNIVVQNCDIHGVGQGVVCGALQGPITIDGCKITNYFEDGIKLGGGFPVTITDNVIEQPLASAGSYGDPHADAIQFLGNREHDWENILIARNIIYAKHTDRSNQGIFLADMGAGYYYSGTQILGNVLVNVGALTTGIRVGQAKDIEVIGNTVVSHMGTTPHGTGILIGEAASAGTHIIKNNIADVIRAGRGSMYENNLVLGIGGAIIPYTVAFSGMTFAPANRDDVLADFAMKPSGPLDKGGNTDNVGAIASGYVTFPTASPGNGGMLDTI